MKQFILLTVFLVVYVNAEAQGLGVPDAHEETAPAKFAPDIELADMVYVDGASPTRPMVDPDQPRSYEEIAYQLHTVQGSIATFYNRSLRRNSGIQGVVVVNFEIQPEGRVSSCSIVASEIADEKLLDSICSRISGLAFESLNIKDSISVNKRFEFVPD